MRRRHSGQREHVGRDRQGELQVPLCLRDRRVPEVGQRRQLRSDHGSIFQAGQLPHPEQNVRRPGRWVRDERRNPYPVSTFGSWFRRAALLSSLARSLPRTIPVFHKSPPWRKTSRERTIYIY